MSRLILLQLLMLLLSVACVEQTPTKKSVTCSSGEQFDPKLRVCAMKTKYPFNTTTTVAINEDEETTLKLEYKDSENDLAKSCVASNFASSLSQLTACQCYGGHCEVKVKSSLNFSGNSSFDYYVVDKDGASTKSTVTVIVNNIDDLPTTNGTTPSGVDALNAFTIDEDTTQIVQLNYVDVDNVSDAKFCQVESNPYTNFYVNDAFTYSNVDYSTCECILGTCSVSIKGEQDYNGTDKSFYFRVNVGGAWSNWESVHFDIDAIDDAPVATSAYTSTAPFSVDEDETDVVKRTVAIPFSDVDSDETTATIHAAVSTGITAVTTACTDGLCFATFTLTPNFNYTQYGLASFTYYVEIDGENSNTETVYIKATQVDDSPVPTPATLGIVEDTPKKIVLSYYDADDDDGTSCEIISGSYTPTNFTFSSTPCSCDNAGECSALLTPYENIGTFSPTNSATFDFKIKTNTLGAFSSPSTITVAMTPVEDAPTWTWPSPSPTYINLGSTYTISGIKLSVGGGDDEQTTQTLCVSVTPVNATAVPITNVKLESVSTPGTTYNLATPATGLNEQTYSLTFTSKPPYTGRSSFVVYIDDDSGGSCFNKTTSPLPKTIDIDVNGIGAIHKGWVNVQAVGEKTDIEGESLESGNVTLAWKSFVMSGVGTNVVDGTTSNTTATVAGYNVYRKAYNENFFSKINSTAVSASLPTYTDSGDNLTPGAKYSYKVVALDSINGTETYPQEIFSTIDVVYPPDNMSFVHRWMVNQEICSKLGKTSDALNGYRCSYTGVQGTPATADYYDIGSDLLVDRFEAGCPYTTQSEDSDCGPNGCIGQSAPNLTTFPVSATATYYNRGNGNCYVYGTDGDVVWKPFQNATPTHFIHEASLMNRAHLPPLVKISQTPASIFCSVRPTPTILGATPVSTTLSLPNRVQQVAFSAWDDDTTNSSTALTDNYINSYETGSNMGTGSSAKCNTSYANGLNDYTNTDFPSESFLYSLPGNLSSSIKSIITGSDQSKLCQSRYGIQDLVGNVREYLNETYGCDGTGICSLDGIGLAFSGSPGAGPCSLSSGNCVSLTNYEFGTIDYNLTDFALPLGLPLVTSGSPDYITIGSSGITQNALHSDGMTFYVTPDATSAPLTYGGSYTSGNLGGRYNLENMSNDSSNLQQADQTTGFRCVFPLQPQQ